MKGNPQKKMVWQDNFIKRWACSAENHPEGWHWWKKHNRRTFRKKAKHELDKEINEAIENSVDF